MHAIVETRGHVPTHFTEQHHAIQLCGKTGAAGELVGFLSGQGGGEAFWAGDWGGEAEEELRYLEDTQMTRLG